MDSKFPPTNPDDKSKSFSDMGARADIELVKSVINNESLPSNEPKKLTGCKGLMGKIQDECYQVSNQLTESLQKIHQKINI